MSTKTSRQERASWLSRRGGHLAIAAAVVLSLFASWTLLAYSGALDPVFRHKGRNASPVAVQSFNSNSPSKDISTAAGA